MLQRILINHTPANALDNTFLNEIYQKLRQADKNYNIQYILLESDKNFIFSSGLDMRRILMGKYSKQKLVHAVWLVYRINKLIINSDKIYIAMLDGGVIGSAVSIAMACDFRIASDRAWFWLPDPQYGGLLADGGLELIQNYIGVSNAKKLCMTNMRMNSQEAYDIGLLSQITTSQELQDTTDIFIKNITEKSYTTLKNAKAILNRRVLKRFQLLKLLKTVYSKELGQRLKNYRL